MKENPLRLYLTYSFVSSALYQMIFTVNLLYYILVAKLDPLQLVLVGTAVEASIFVFEIPTGVVADSYSRRLSVIIGIFLVGVAFIINGLFPVFWIIAMAQVVWGLGYTFTSGAQQAWISDELGEEEASLAFVRGSKMDQLGGIAGILLSIGFALISLRAPILIGGGLFLLLGLYLCLRMPEKGFSPIKPNERETWKNLFSTFKRGLAMVRIRPALISILAVGFLFGLYSEGYDRLWQAHLLERFTLPLFPGLASSVNTGTFNLVIWMAALKGSIMLLSAIALARIDHQMHRPRMKSLINGLTVCSGLLVASLIGFALAGNLWVMLILIVGIGVLRAIIDPIYTAWVNHRLDSSVRATVISLSSQMDAVGQIAGGPVVGGIAKNISMSAGLVTSGMMLAPVLIMLVLQRNKEDKITE